MDGLIASEIYSVWAMVKDSNYLRFKIRRFVNIAV